MRKTSTLASSVLSLLVGCASAGSLGDVPEHHFTGGPKGTCLVQADQQGQVVVEYRAHELNRQGLRYGPLCVNASGTPLNRQDLWCAGKAYYLTLRRQAAAGGREAVASGSADATLSDPGGRIVLPVSPGVLDPGEILEITLSCPAVG